MKDIVAISAMIRPNLVLEEQTPLATMLYETGTSSQATRGGEESEDEAQETNINDSLQVITAHLKNIQVQSAIDKEEKKLAQLQALQMAEVNDELQEKIQRYEIELAMEKSKVNAEQERVKSFIQDRDELAHRLSEALKLCEEKDKQMTRMQKTST